MIRVSQESARFFCERITHDRGFARCFEGVDSLDALMEIVRRSGYDFTREELKCAIVSLSDMSEENLAYVTGGADPTWAVLLKMLT